MIAAAPNSTAGVSFRVLLYVPIAVRTGAQITSSVIGILTELTGSEYLSSSPAINSGGVGPKLLQIVGQLPDHVGNLPGTAVLPKQSKNGSHGPFDGVRVR